MREVENIWREVLIDTGYYKSERALVNVMKKAIAEDDVALSFSQSSKRLKLILPENYTLYFNEPLSSMLGIGHGNVVCTNAMKRGISHRSRTWNRFVICILRCGTRCLWRNGFDTERIWNWWFI